MNRAMFPVGGIVPAPDDAAAAVARRIRNVLTAANLDCQCRDRLDEALERFTRLESQRATRQLLLQAQHQRLHIASLLDLLQEIEDFSLGEFDATVFEELAGLFEDVAAAALTGADAMRRLSGSGASE